jgi:hypothetical protein
MYPSSLFWAETDKHSESYISEEYPPEDLAAKKQIFDHGVIPGVDFKQAVHDAIDLLALEDLGTELDDGRAGEEQMAVGSMGTGEKTSSDVEDSGDRKRKGRRGERKAGRKAAAKAVPEDSASMQRSNVRAKGTAASPGKDENQGATLSAKTQAGAHADYKGKKAAKERTLRAAVSSTVGSTVGSDGGQVASDDVGNDDLQGAVDQRPIEGGAGGSGEGVHELNSGKGGGKRKLSAAGAGSTKRRHTSYEGGPIGGDGGVENESSPNGLSPNVI